MQHPTAPTHLVHGAGAVLAEQVGRVSGQLHAGCILTRPAGHQVEQLLARALHLGVAHRQRLALALDVPRLRSRGGGGGGDGSSEGNVACCGAHGRVTNRRGSVPPTYEAGSTPHAINIPPPSAHLVRHKLLIGEGLVGRQVQQPRVRHRRQVGGDAVGLQVAHLAHKLLGAGKALWGRGGGRRRQRGVALAMHAWWGGQAG